VADLNQDGKPDLVVAATTGGNGVVSVLLGNGDGTFQAATIYDSGGQFALSVVIGDVNGDGKPDLVAANKCSDDGNISCGNPKGEVGVLLSRGDGTFQAARTYYVDGVAAVGDVNGDGKEDLIVIDPCVSNGNCPNGVGVLLGNGDGTFATIPLSYGSGGHYVSAVVVADVNGDGKPDLLIANQCASPSDCSSGTVGVLLGNGDGTFQPPVVYSSGGYTAVALAVGDVNGDGKLDVVVGNQCDTSNCTNQSTLAVLLGNGDGTFQGATTYSTGGRGVLSVVIAGVNGDGKPDLVVGNECASTSDCTGTVGVLVGNGDGSFKAPIVSGSGGYIGLALAAGDVNGDGKLDVVVASLCASTSNCAVGQNGQLSILLGNSDGTFQLPTTITTPPLDRGPLAVADFDGDGNLDIVSAVGGFLLLGRGDGTFQPSQPLNVGGIAMVVGDFNGDGRPDLAIRGVTILMNISTNVRHGTITKLTSSVNPSVSGTPVMFKATVSSRLGAPTGKVEFLNGTAVVATRALTAGVATYSTSALPVGLTVVTAVYEGDVNNNGSTSAPLNHVVLATTTTTITSSQNPSSYGQEVSFVAAVTSSIGVPFDGETLTFKQGAKMLGTAPLSGGSATITLSTLAVGKESITAVYGGYLSFAQSSSKAVNQTVGKASTSTTLSSSKDPSTLGQSVIFTATVTPQFSGTPMGSVTFLDGTTTLKTVALTGGIAIFNTTKLGSGSHSITAHYKGNVDFTTSSGMVTQAVQ
jgi:hypothetical protein